MSEITLDVGLALKLKNAFGRNGWTEKNIDDICEGDKLARVLRFVDNGCRLSVSGPNTLVIDRSHPFDPVKFIGDDWKIDEPEDQLSLRLTEIDYSKIYSCNGLKIGESRITGEEKLKRLKEKPVILLDAKIGQVLYEEEGQTTLRFVHEYFGVSWFEFAGTVLRSPNGYRYFLSLYRLVGGSWYWRYDWLDDDRYARYVSPVLAR